METIFIFLLKASSGIVLFYLVYWFFLRKETFYTANRWFLLTALFTAIFLPLFPVQYSVLADPENNETVLKSISDTFKNIPVVSASELPDEKFNWQQAILLVYLTGASLFLLRLLIQTFILIRLMIKHRVKSLDGIRVVENEKYGLPFSFFNIVFFNPKFHTQEDLPDILAHEKVHIRENHWFDLLFIELLTVIFWFNPFIWFFEHSIKQNHEYLADKGVLAQGHNAGRYQALLINQLMGMQIIGITNNLNFALNTNRLKMMTKKKTPVSRRTKFALALPAIALLLFAFAEPNYQLKKANEYDSETLQKKVSDKTVKLAGTVVDENGEPLPGTAIVIKGGTVGTVCDIDGKFNLDVPENEAIILSFVGKKTFVDTFEGITSENKKDGAYNRKYQLKDDIIGIGLAEKLIPSKELIPPPPPPPPAPIVNGDKEVFYIVEDMPAYPGGSGALNNYVYKMQQKLAQAKGIKGKAKVAFTVNGKGKVSDIKIVEQDNDGVGKGAVEIVSALEDWTPGKQRGKAVSVKYLLPIEFK
jgi:TonB family protein